MIEKGTADALMCDKGTNAKLVWEESARVARKAALLITHGSLMKRAILLKGIECKKIDCARQPLSSQADLINCLRSVGDGSLKQTFADKTKLAIAILKCELNSQN